MAASSFKTHPTLRSGEDCRHFNFNRLQDIAPGTPQTFLRFIDAAMRLVKPDIQRYFAPAASSEEIVAEIAARIEQGKPIEGAKATIEGITHILLNCAWKPVVDAITKKLNDTGPLNAAAIAAWLALLLPLAMTGASRDANDWLRNAAKAIMLHHLQNVRADQSAASRCLFVILVFNPTGEVTAVGQSWPAPRKLCQFEVASVA